MHFASVPRDPSLRYRFDRVNGGVLTGENHQSMMPHPVAFDPFEQQRHDTRTEVYDRLIGPMFPVSKRMHHGFFVPDAFQLLEPGDQSFVRLFHGFGSYMYVPPWYPSMVIFRDMTGQPTGDPHTPLHDVATGPVLLVDDDLQLLGTLQRLFQIWGHECVTVSTPEEALDLFVRLWPPLVVSDYDFGLRSATTGVDFLDQVRTLHPDTRRVLLTGALLAPAETTVAHRVLRKGNMANLADVVDRELALFHEVSALR